MNLYEKLLEFPTHRMILVKSADTFSGKNVTVFCEGLYVIFFEDGVRSAVGHRGFRIPVHYFNLHNLLNPAFAAYLCKKYDPGEDEE